MKVFIVTRADGSPLMVAGARIGAYETRSSARKAARAVRGRVVEYTAAGVDVNERERLAIALAEAVTAAQECDERGERDEDIFDAACIAVALEAYRKAVGR